jgi:hypothetical protein
MIITKIKGGLGNQLFQYAIGKNIAIKNKALLKLDLSFYHYNRNRQYLLNKFSITENIASKKEITQLTGSFYSNNIFRKYRRNNRSRLSTHYIENQVHFDSNFINILDNSYIDGYWQSEKYFENINDILKIEYTLKNQISEETTASIKLIERETQFQFIYEEVIT